MRYGKEDFVGGIGNVQVLLDFCRRRDIAFFAVGTTVVAVVALTVVAVASLTAIVFHTLFAAGVVVRFDLRLFAIGLNVHVLNTVFRRLMTVALVTAVVAAAFIAVLFRLGFRRHLSQCSHFLNVYVFNHFLNTVALVVAIIAAVVTVAVAAGVFTLVVAAFV